ncbi:MAG: hypothetical protein IJ624_07490 [Prevotella sp.]|nr:hypothetical protein [Prevotella sp.]
MDRIKYLFMLSLLISSFGVAQNTREITLTFEESDFNYSTDSLGRMVITSDSLECFYDEDTNSPMLPMLSVKVVVGETDVFDNLSIIGNEEVIATNVILAPNPEIITISTKSILNDSTSYNPSGIYPQENVRYVGSCNMDGCKVFFLKICPFIYNADTRVLKLNDSLRIIIALSNNTSQQGVISDILSKSKIKKMVINPSVIDSLYSVKIPTSLDSTKYLIVTTDSLKSAFQRLARWKTQKGILTKIITTEEISQNYSEGSMIKNIKKAIKDCWEDTDGRLKYVLLGGDKDVIHPLMYFMRIGSVSYYIPSDYYYACLENLDWGSGSSDSCQVQGADINFFPNVVVTRAYVKTKEQANNFVNRIIEYERYPDIDKMHNNILMAGNRLKISGNNFECDDAERQSAIMYRDYIEPYWHGSRFRFFNSYTDYPEGAGYEYSAEHMQTELGKGYSFVDVYCHGYDDSWNMEGNGHHYTSVNAAELFNPGYTIITTESCLTANYMSTNYVCLMESLIKNKNSGILGYIGCTSIGWGCHGDTVLLSSIQYNGNYYKELFTSQHPRFGESLKGAKINLLGKAIESQSNMFKWVMLGLTGFGDAEMPVYIENPSIFDSVTIDFTDSSITVNTGIPNCRICVMSTDSVGYYCIVDSVQRYTFANIPMNVSVCITKSGFIPKTYYVGDTIFIQNEKLKGYNHYKANAVYIGSDVNANKEQGNVVVEKEKTIITGRRETIITKGFEVKLGASFEINPY